MDTDIKLDERLECEDTYNLIDILVCQMDLIYYLSEVEQNGLYDAFQEDKIKCFSNAFKTMELAQKQLQKQLRK